MDTSKMLSLHPLTFMVCFVPLKHLFRWLESLSWLLTWRNNPSRLLHVTSASEGLWRVRTSDDCSPAVVGRVKLQRRKWRGYECTSFYRFCSLQRIHPRPMLQRTPLYLWHFWLRKSIRSAWRKPAIPKSFLKLINSPLSLLNSLVPGSLCSHSSSW